MNLKKHLYLFPSILVIIYTFVVLVKTPEISDSIVLVALSALAGFLVYLKSKEISLEPMSKEKKELIDQIDIIKHRRELAALNVDLMTQNKKLELGGNLEKTATFKF